MDLYPVAGLLSGFDRNCSIDETADTADMTIQVIYESEVSNCYNFLKASLPPSEFEWIPFENGYGLQVAATPVPKWSAP